MSKRPSNYRRAYPGLCTILIGSIHSERFDFPRSTFVPRRQIPLAPWPRCHARQGIVQLVLVARSSTAGIGLLANPAEYICAVTVCAAAR